MNVPQSRDKITAVAITCLIATVMLLCLIFGTISWSKESLSKANPPAKEEEELFIDPELLNLGEPDAISKTNASPAPNGEPEYSEQPTEELAIQGENPKPSTSTEKLMTSKAESDIKVNEPTKTDQQESKISSSMKDKFSMKNGKEDGEESHKGAGGDGSGVQGSINGRSFKGCSLPSVKVNKPVTIYVSIVVDESGKVVEARFKSDKGAGAGNQALRNACVKASYNARWSAKKGEPRATGTLTWNLKPRS